MKYLVTLHELSVVDNELEALGPEIGYNPKSETRNKTLNRVQVP